MKTRRRSRCHFSPEARALGRALLVLAGVVLEIAATLLRLALAGLRWTVHSLERKSSSCSRATTRSRGSPTGTSGGRKTSAPAARNTRSDAGPAGKTNAFVPVSRSQSTTETPPTTSLAAARLVAGLSGLGFKRADAQAFAAKVAARVDREPIAELLREGIAACASKKVGS
jgi:hypothetical protein